MTPRRQQAGDLVVADLTEVGVVDADRSEPFDGVRTHDVVGVAAQRIDGVPCSNGHGQHDACGGATA
ncbi:MAG: hypothetical protein WD377_05090, partial [Nitriliruptoraceae bacterium]